MENSPCFDKTFKKAKSDHDETLNPSYNLEEKHYLQFSGTAWHNDPEVGSQSKSDPAGILQQGQTQLRRLCVNHPRVVAAIQAGQEGSRAQCQTSWHHTETQ